jgi:hypothetical protein
MWARAQIPHQTARTSLAESGDLTQAEALQRDTVPKLRKKLGPHHPDTLTCEANLAVTLHQAGRGKEAKQARTRTLDNLSQVLGPQHPDVLSLRDWRQVNRRVGGVLVLDLA